MSATSSSVFNDPFARFVHYTLPNGLSVRYAYFPVNFMVCRFLVHAGAREDPPELRGASHLLEHLVGENIPGISNRQARQLFVSWGKDPFFGEISYIGTWYGFKIPCQPQILKEALGIFGGMLVNATIERAFDDQKAVILEELHDEGRLKFVREARDRGFRVQFPGHGLEGYRGELGTVEAVEAATLADLQTLYNQQYHPNNIEVIVAGGIECQDLLDSLGQSPLGQNRRGGRNAILPPLTNIPLPQESLYTTSLSRREMIVSSGQLENTDVFSRGVVPSDIFYEAVRLFCILLEEVLFRVIREKETATYGIPVDLRFRQEFYFIEVEGRVSSRIAKNFPDLLSRCIDRVAHDLDLFEKYRAGQLADAGMFDSSVEDLVEGAVNRLRILQRIPTLSENWAGYDLLTLGDMREIANYLQAERRWTCILEP